MTKWIKNNTGADKTWVSQVVGPGAYYQIQPHEENNWANNSALLTDIGTSDAVVAKDDSGNSDISDVAAGINHLKDLAVSEVHIVGTPAFADKKTAAGDSLFNRTAGASFSLTTGTNTLEYSIPWATAKFNGLEIINGELGDIVNLKVLDTDTGTYSTIPNYQLNQFGYTVNVRPAYYVRESRYDADLYSGMRVVLEYESVSAKTLYVNYLVHEVK